MIENSNTMHCDVEGVHALLGRAIKLCPGLGSWQLDDAWAGLRPTTTDGPLFGRTRWPNRLRRLPEERHFWRRRRDAADADASLPE